MKVLSDLFEKKNIGQMFLCILCILYLLFGYSMPIEFANFINSKLGYMTVIFITILIILFLNPIVGILSFFVAYELIKRAMNYYNTSYQQGLNSLAQYNPKEKGVKSPFSLDKQWIPFTLEEEIIQKMIPKCKDDLKNNLEISNFSPLSENTYNALNLTQD